MRSSFLIATILCLLLAARVFAGAGEKDEAPKPPQTTEELRQQLEQLLKKTHTPGISIAIVHRDGPEWIGGIGLADVATGRPVTADTLFRIGSTSKAFASLSILQLVNADKLSLDDPVHKLVPEVWYENRWEATDPIRVVHLLEHTTGWDDMHFREYSKDAPNIGLREAFDYDHTSRISRWRPGTRMAYCNSGPPVAAYIVEKITGERFEDYVQKSLFDPIGMKTATYFQPASSVPSTTLYHDDGKTPYRYWNIIYRPSGAINASANDMANYVRFYLNRGLVNGVQIVPSASIDRMESPASTWAARDGLKTGYGLGNYWSTLDGFVYHGHDGGVEGGLTDMAYMPDYNVGYFFSINSGNGDTFERAGKLIRSYITHTLQKPALPAPAPVPASAARYAGWYEPASPRIQLMYFLERMLGMVVISFNRDQLLVTGLGNKDSYIPVSGTQFRLLPKKDAPQPVATLALLTPNDEGQFIQVGLQGTMRHIPAWFAVSQLVVTALVLLAMISILVYAPIWLIGGLFKKRRRPAERAMRIWPLLTVLTLICTVWVFNLASNDLVEALGNPTRWSVAVFLLTIFFAVAALMSAIAIWRAPYEGVRKGVRIYSKLVTPALLIATLYFAYWGIIGLRTWA